MRAPLLLATFSLALLSACGGGQSVDRPASIEPATRAPLSVSQLIRIDTYVQAQMASGHIPGLTLVVSLDGKSALAKAYGVSNLAASTPATVSTAFRIGSITKQFTASAIMLLVQEGRIGLDDKVSRYLPTAPATWNAITIRHLLQHTSGLPRDLPPSLLAQVDGNVLPSIDGMVALAGQIPLTAQPGAVHSYSNVGYHLLGFVIEKVTGQYFADFLQQRVFAPLAMTSADVIRSTRPGGAMATGYIWDGNGHRPASDLFLTPGYIEAEGNLQMNALDLAKWDAALLTERVLTKASLAQMWTRAPLNDGTTAPYGFGWALDEINKRPYTWHDGAVEGFTSSFARHTHEGLSVIVLDNLDGAPATRIAAGVAAIVKPELAWVVTSDPIPAMGRLLRSFMDEIEHGSLEVDERFAPQLRAALSSEVVSSFVEYFKPWGPMLEIGYVDQAPVNGVLMARYLVRAKNDQILIGMALDANGKVSALVPITE